MKWVLLRTVKRNQSEIANNIIAECAENCRSTPISVEEIRNQLAMMKGNKACDPDLIPIEVWKKMGEEGIVFLKKELIDMLTSGIPFHGG